MQIFSCGATGAGSPFVVIGVSTTPLTSFVSTDEVILGIELPKRDEEGSIESLRELRLSPYGKQRIINSQEWKVSMKNWNCWETLTIRVKCNGSVMRSGGGQGRGLRHRVVLFSRRARFVVVRASIFVHSVST